MLTRDLGAAKGEKYKEVKMKVKDLVWIKNDPTHPIQAKYLDTTGKMMLGVITSIETSKLFEHFTVGILAKDGSRWYIQGLNGFQIYKFHR
jgi:hypothetical protein